MPIRNKIETRFAAIFSLMFDATPVQNAINLILKLPLLWIISGSIKDFFISILKTGPVPKHVGLIMDGNRRYAKKKALALKDGHLAGAASLVSVSDTTKSPKAF